MATAAHTLNRMRDVVLALNEAKKVRLHPTRIQLQKFIYLADVLGQVVGVLKPHEGHKTYRNGPYDPAIQNAVDALAFRGLVRIAGVWPTPSGRMGTSYAIAAGGVQLLERILSHPSLVLKVKMAELVGDELRRLGWDRIVRLVYAEPTYVTTRPGGWGSQLRAEDGLQVSTAFVVALMRRVVSTLLEDGEATPEWIVDRFFAFLNDYDRTANDGTHEE